MFNEFTLKIKLGNETMQSGPDVARALRAVADQIENDLEARGNIRDTNGNMVGRYGPDEDEHDETAIIAALTLAASMYNDPTAVLDELGRWDARAAEAVRVNLAARQEADERVAERG